MNDSADDGNVHGNICVSNACVSVKSMECDKDSDDPTYAP